MKQSLRALYSLLNIQYGGNEIITKDDTYLGVRSLRPFSVTLPSSDVLSRGDIFKILRENKKYEQACRLISGLTDEEFNELGSYLHTKYVTGRFVPDFFLNGFLIEYPHGKIIKQFELLCFYRGENRVYPSSRPSLYRTQEAAFDNVESIYRLRLQLFRRALNQLDVIKAWEYGTVLHEAIGQHYGLRTRLLDITSSFLAALFFATTYYSEGKYHPITMEFIAKHPEYSRGSLYFYIGRNPSLLEIHRLESHEPNPVLPIGYQPFMRCAGQYGYMLYGDREYNLVEDNRFVRYTFLQDDSLSLDIFNKCHGGASVFPLDGSDLIATIASRVNGLRRFSFITLQESDISKDDARLLEKGGVSFCEEDDLGLVAKDEEIDEFNRRYREFDFERYYGIRLRTRRVIR